MISGHSSILRRQPSRPQPDCLMPPNGANSLEFRAAPHATFQGLAGSPRMDEIVRVEIGGQAEPGIGVVGGGHCLVVGLEAEQQRHRPEDFLACHADVCRGTADHGGRTDRAAQLMDAAISQHASAFCRGVDHQRKHLVDCRVFDQRMLVPECALWNLDAQERSKLLSTVEISITRVA